MMYCWCEVAISILNNYIFLSLYRDSWQIVGSIAYVHIPNEKRQNQDPKLEKCILVGYSLKLNGYKCYNPSTQKVIVSRNVIFDESISWYEPEPTSPKPILAYYEIEEDNELRHTWE